MPTATAPTPARTPLPDVLLDKLDGLASPSGQRLGATASETQRLIAEIRAWRAQYGMPNGLDAPISEPVALERAAGR